MSKSALMWNPVSPLEGNEQRACQRVGISARIRSPEEVVIHHIHQGKTTPGQSNNGNGSMPLETDVVSPVFCIAPREWLVVSKSESTVREMTSDLENVSDFPCYQTDFSDRYSVIELSGAGVMTTLARGTGIDLEGQCEEVGHYVQTRLFDRPVIIHKVSANGDFDIYVDRSLAVQLMIWLFDDE